jgi:hypothetical protein
MYLFRYLILLSLITPSICIFERNGKIFTVVLLEKEHKNIITGKKKRKIGFGLQLQKPPPLPTSNHTNQQGDMLLQLTRRYGGSESSPIKLSHLSHLVQQLANQEWH